MDVIPQNLILQLFIQQKILLYKSRNARNARAQSIDRLSQLFPKMQNAPDRLIR